MSTPTEIPGSLAKISIKDTTFKEIGGLIAITPADEATEADTTHRQKGGIKSHLIAERTKTIKCTGRFLIDPTDGARDAGQAALETLANAIGLSSIGVFKLELAGVTGWTKYFKASAKIDGWLGDMNESASFDFTLSLTTALLATDPSL